MPDWGGWATDPEPKYGKPGDWPVDACYCQSSERKQLYNHRSVVEQYKDGTMHHEYSPEGTMRPALRAFRVSYNVPNNNGGITVETTTVIAHLVFNNSERGEGLVFRRYYEDSVKTEKVAEFQNWNSYVDITDYDPKEPDNG